jgi:DnaJ family protein C protein 17
MSADLPPDLDIYAFLEVSPSATGSEITKAYRQKSLLYHPDKNPSPAAVEKLHYVRLARDILLSPTARTAYDNVRKAKAAKAERIAKFDDDRRRMQKDLEDRERESKKRKFDFRGEEDEDRNLRQALERLQAESERLKRERDEKLRATLSKDAEAENENQRTVKVRFRKNVDRNSLSTDMIEELFSQYGDIEDVLLAKSALVVYETALGAKTALSKVMNSEDPFVAMIKEVSMAQNISNKDGDTKDQTDSNDAPRASYPILRPTAPKFSFKSSNAQTGDSADYESITLLRMRKLEREKLEREIREQEEKEE